MPGAVLVTSRVNAGSAMKQVKLAMDIPSKMKRLGRLKRQLLDADAVLLSELLPQIIELLADPFSPVRRFVTEIIGEIGYRDIDFFPDIVPALLNVSKDSNPAVARQAIACGTRLFRCALIKVALEGLYSSETEESHQLWDWMLKFKEKIYTIAFMPGCEGVRFLALKFVESVILLYTPDPDGSSEPPPAHVSDSSTMEFNISWLRGGHPLLNVRDLSTEAIQSLGLLLDQLRNAEMKSLSHSTVIVLINGLSEIANRRPAFYGRILPVLLGLDPPISVINGIRVTAIQHNLKRAFCSCLKCTHPVAVPWRDRLVDALGEMNPETLLDVCVGSAEKTDVDFLEGTTASSFSSKRTRDHHRISELIYNDDGVDVDDDDLDVSLKRIKTSPFVPDPLPDEDFHGSDEITSPSPSPEQAASEGDGDGGPVQQLVAMFGALVAQGEKAVNSLDILVSSISSDLLAEVIITNMRHLPSFCPCSEADEPHKSSFHGVNVGVQHLPSFVADILSPPPPPQSNDEFSRSFIPSDILDAGSPIGEIPGLSSTARVDFLDPLPPDEIPKGPDPFSVIAGAEDDRAADRESLEPDGAVPVSSADAVSPSSNRPVLPAISTPVVDLTDEESERLQKLSFARILDDHRKIEASGGFRVRTGLLASLSVQFPSEFDHWKLVSDHVLSDYAANSGHELTLSVLYRLFGEAEEERDFFSSSTASSTYDAFLSSVAGSLRDTFPASDKSLSRLISEVPRLPDSALSLVESLCLSGDRVTQGLSAVWNVVLARPSARRPFLRVALRAAVHETEETRMKAIRLLANKLYPLPHSSNHIEEFAREMMLSATKDSEDAQRLMSLYFALCTKKHSLFREIFCVYGDASGPAKQSVDRQVPILVRTMGSSSPDLLRILSDPPPGSEGLVVQVVNALTEFGSVPSAAFVSTVRRLYESRMKDSRLLVRVLPFMEKDEVLQVLPLVVGLPPDRLPPALHCIIGSRAAGPSLTPAELLIAVHAVNPNRDGVPSKKIMEACNACFEEREVFTQQVLAQVLNQLVEQTPLPMLLMRTVLQAVAAFPPLFEFIMDILSRLVKREIWKREKLWEGFLRCAVMAKPQSFGVLLQLPPAQLENALASHPGLKQPLAAYAGQSNVRGSVPRSLLVLLGVCSDSQTPAPSHPAIATSSQVLMSAPPSSTSCPSLACQPSNSQASAADTPAAAGSSESSVALL